jgi:acyl-homoserine lactone acylase PvdQ
MDRSVWRTTPYTEAELQQQFDQADEVYGAEGALVQRDVQNYVDGINQYIAEARVGPPVVAPGSMIPGEYAPAALNRPLGPDPWQVTDVIATASLVAGIFGRGGGGELESALILQRAQERFGEAGGSAVWSDFRSANDAETPTTIDDPFPYGIPPANPEGVALPDPGTLQPEPIVVPDGAAAAAAARRPLFKGLASLEGASNALLVSAQESASGHPIAVMGPQVSYFAPQILMEQDIHGPGIDANGAAFAGANMYVQLGHGRDYAWSATSAGQNITDTFAVPLCNPAGGRASTKSNYYVLRGKCVQMETLTRSESWTPNLGDFTPAGSITLETQRTAFGLVIARATINGRPVAYCNLRSTYMHELDSSVGFERFNNPAEIRSPQDFFDAAYNVGYTFNWFYADDTHIAYFNAGLNPIRAPGTNPLFPTWSRYPWVGYSGASHTTPASLTEQQTPQSAHPQTTDQDYLTSWNNKQAPDYQAPATGQQFSSVFRSQLLDQNIDRYLAQGHGKMTLADLVNAMGNAGTQDLRGVQVLPYALKIIGTPSDPTLAQAVAALRTWVATGAHRINRTRPGASGNYEQTDAVRIMDAWWPLLVEAEFRPVLGARLLAEVERAFPINDQPGHGVAGSHVGSAWEVGFYGIVQKDLRAALGEHVRGPLNRIYCGDGSRAKCRAALRSSLRRALEMSPQAVYPADGVCSAGDQMCSDSIQFRAIGAITQPLLEWINRPTFQQADEIQGHRRP